MSVDKYYIGWNVVNGKVWPFRTTLDAIQNAKGAYLYDPCSLVELTPEQAAKDLRILDEEFKDHPKRPRIQDIPQ